MQTGVIQRRAVERHRYDTHRRFERERLWTDLLTEGTERVDGAMHNTFEYVYKDEDFFFQGQSLKKIFLDGIQTAEEIVKIRPEFSIELLRRHIEYAQFRAQIAFFQSDQEGSGILMHMSPTPDSVLSGQVDLKAYDKSRKKTMVRITERTADGIRVTSMSLDGGDRVALQAVADMFGAEIPDAATSEDILAMNFLGHMQDLKGERPSKVIRERYDAAMKLQYGGEWYAGRQDSKILDTKLYIEKFPSIINEHVYEIEQIRTKYGVNFRFTPEYERATYNFLAAIEQAHQLGTVVGSLSDAGDAARAEGKEYANGDCPIASTMSPKEMLAKQGIGEKIWMHCPFCGAAQFGDPCASSIMCTECEASVVNGEVVSTGNGGKKPRVHANNSETIVNVIEAEPTDTQFEAIIKTEFGEHAILSDRVAIGGTVRCIRDKRTDIILQDNYILAA